MVVHSRRRGVWAYGYLGVHTPVRVLVVSLSLLTWAQERSIMAYLLKMLFIVQ